MGGERLVKNKRVTEQSHFGVPFRKWFLAARGRVTEQSHFGGRNLARNKKVTKQSHFVVPVSYYGIGKNK